LRESGQGQEVLGLLVAPVGVEPGAGAAGPPHRHSVAHEDGQVQLDSAERPHDVGHGRVEGGVTAVPRDVVAQRPAPLGLGALKELAIQPVESRFEVCL
jgi:hypothetical protein